MKKKNMHRVVAATVLLPLTAAMFISSASALASSPVAPQLGVDKLDDVVEALTLQEKVKLIRGTGMDMGDTGPVVGSTKDKVPGAAGTTHAIERLGIPSIVLADGPAGLRIAPHRKGDATATFYATAFPIATSLSSTWNRPLVEQVGTAIGKEAKEYGVDILLSPALNVHRFALGGRNFEYFSEDPLLSGTMAAAMVNGVQSQGVGASLKHFVANNHEWNRNLIDVVVSERALREIYLRGFEIAVKQSNPWTVMSSYNKVNGEYTSESSELLTDVLRKQWGFNGVVMTDWFGGQNPVAQMQAGNDLLMPGMDHQEAMIANAVEQGTLDKTILDRNVKNILSMVLSSPTFNQYHYSNSPDLDKHAQLSREAAEEGMVLLKNNSVLPLSEQSSIALFGNHSFDIIIGGTGSGDVNEAYVVSLEEGLQHAGVSTAKELVEEYKAHIALEETKRPVSTSPLADAMPKAPLNEYQVSHEQAAHAAQKHAAAVITIGRSSGEFVDREVSDFYLTEKEHTMIEVVSKAFRQQKKPVVVVLNVGGVIEMASWRDKADAILLTYQPGQEAGHAIANVLLGNTNPSGKLPDTWPIDLPDYPAHEGFPGKVVDPSIKPEGVLQTVPATVHYDDGIMVGYRFFNSENKAVAYPFGFGLSYTTFTYSDMSVELNKETNTLTVQLKITNSGSVAGKEVVQLYVSAPSDGMVKPENELREYSKTKTLAPKQSETLSFTIDVDTLASFSEDNNAWIVAKGGYQLHIGSSSRDSKLQADFTIDRAIMIKP